MSRTQVRPAGPPDAGALHDLVAGLSLESAHRRFLVGVGAPSARMVAALLRRDATHGAWVCTATDDAARVVGHAIWGVDDGAAEIGVVVADAWQRQGIGRRLAAAAAAEASAHGLSQARLVVHPQNHRLARRLSAGATAAVLADGVLTITRPLADLVVGPVAGAAATVPAARAAAPPAGQVLKAFWARSRPWLTSASTASAARSTS